MGYFLVSAPELDTPRAPHCPPFEGPVKGFDPNGDLGSASTLLWDDAKKMQDQNADFFQAMNEGKPLTSEGLYGLPPIPESVEAKFFHLRDKWIEIFTRLIEEDNNNAPPRPWMLEWLDSKGVFPKTHDQLAIDVTIIMNIQRVAVACLDAWHAL